MKARIILHGGAGDWKIDDSRRKKVESCMKKAVEEGLRAIKKGSAADGLLASIIFMEDSALFNAGKGAYPNIENDIEFDAGLMDGKTLKVGAIAAAKNISNPIALAYRIMTETDHCLIAGEGAERIAKAFNLWKKAEPDEYASELFKKNVRKYIKKESWLIKFKHVYNLPSDTIGGVAIDDYGNIASATSTGGTIFKVPGRVGDSPVVGSGFYALNGHGGCSATGTGEDIMRFCLSSRVVYDLDGKTDPFKVLVRELEEMRRLLGNRSAGAVCLDASGHGAVYTLTPAIAVAAGYGSTVVESRVARYDELVPVQRRIRMNSV
jgi:Asparaginase